MDNNNISVQAAIAAGCDPAQAENLAGAFAAVLRDRCAALDTVAIPGFGSFSAEKTDEHVAIDSATGQRTLFPPAINMHFTPGSMLRKHLSHE